MKNKKGVVAFEFLYGLIFLFALALLFIVLNQVIVNYGIPSSENLVPDSFVGKSDIVATDNEFLTFWNIMPYMFLILIIFFWIISAIKKKGTEP